MFFISSSYSIRLICHFLCIFIFISSSDITFFYYIIHPRYLNFCLPFISRSSSTTKFFMSVFSSFFLKLISNSVTVFSSFNYYKIKFILILSNDYLVIEQNLTYNLFSTKHSRYLDFCVPLFEHRHPLPNFLCLSFLLFFLKLISNSFAVYSSLNYYETKVIFISEQ